MARAAAITRADFVMALIKLSGADVSGYRQSSFSDVSDSSEYMPYIEWAADNGIVQGGDDGKFMPDSPITREQMALMMTNYAKALGYAPEDNDLFKPQGGTTRAGAAAILRRFVENVISSRDAEGFCNANTDLNKRVYYTRNDVALIYFFIEES